MTDTSTPDISPLQSAFKTTHRSVLGLLVVCLIVIVSQGIEGDEPAPDRALATIGIGFGLTTIVLRRLGSSPTITLKTSLFLGLASLLSSAGLGGLGVYIAIAQAGPQTGLLFTFAGLIFAMRPTAQSPRRPVRRD
jgi:hypothetical protein